MIVNNIDISQFDAKLLKKDIQLSEVQNKFEWIEGSLLPLKLREREVFRVVTLEILVKTETLEDNIKQCSSIINLLKDCDVEFEDMKGKHKLYMIEHERTKSVRLETSRLFVELAGYYYEEEPEFTLEGRTGSIFVPGNMETQAVVTITPQLNMIDLTIKGLGNDIIIRNLKSNTPIVIDGEKGLITEGAKNKFGETDMWGFPYLKPGRNTVSINKDNVNVKIKYKSRWI